MQVLVSDCCDMILRIACTNLDQLHELILIIQQYDYIVVGVIVTVSMNNHHLLQQPDGQEKKQVQRTVM